MVKKNVIKLTIPPGLSEDCSAEQARFIRALYDAAEKVLKDQIDGNESFESARQNSEELAALLSKAGQIGSSSFAEAAENAMASLTGHQCENEKGSSQDD
jgi:hypothetical protein